MPDFNNTEIAFQEKSNQDLRRSHFLFNLLNYPRLMKVGIAFLNFVLKINLPVKGIVKATIFKQFCGGETVIECRETVNILARQNVYTILDYSVEGRNTDADFERCTNNVTETLEEAAQNKNIAFAVFKVTAISRFELLEKLSANKPLTEEEKKEFGKTEKRIDRICAKAYQTGVPVFIDAEESWIQHAVDELALEMMRKYNTEKAIVYNTMQMYRWDRMAYLKQITASAKNNGHYLGIKSVRGAYLEKERERAEKLGYEDPIHKTKEDTDKDFNLSLKFCIENLDCVSLCCGSHNEESSIYLLKLMKEHGLSNNDKRVFFAQLLGMSDHISFNLAKDGYNVAKYVPFGYIKEVLPYLTRRAEENTSIKGQTSRELNLIKKELRRRKGH